MNVIFSKEMVFNNAHNLFYLQLYGLKIPSATIS